LARGIGGFLNSYTENLVRILEDIRDFEVKRIENLQTLKILFREAIRSINALQKLVKLLENPRIWICSFDPIIEYPFAAKFIYCGCRKCKEGKLHGPYLYLIRGKKWIYQGKIAQGDVSTFLEGLPYKILNVVWG